MEEKKRPAGKFNLIDVIVLVIIVAALVLFGSKVMGNRGLAESQKSRIEYTVLVKSVVPEACDAILEYKTANAQLMANGSMVDGYVTDITASPHTEVMAENGAAVRVEDGTMDMVVTIQAAVDSTLTNKVGTQEVRVGKSHIVKTVDFELEGYKSVILSRKTLE